MGLMNLRYYERGSMFWDERAATLEDQVLMPIQDEIEMGLDLPELVLRVESAPYYAPLFTQAFGSPQITTDRISRALAQFVRAITSVSAVIFLVSAKHNMATSFIVGRVENGEFGLAIAYSAVLIVTMLAAILLLQLLVGTRRLRRADHVQKAA